MFKIVSRYVYTDIFEVIDSANCYDEALRLKYEVLKAKGLLKEKKPQVVYKK